MCAKVAIYIHTYRHICATPTNLQDVNFFGFATTANATFYTSTFRPQLSSWVRRAGCCLSTYVEIQWCSVLDGCGSRFSCGEALTSHTIAFIPYFCCVMKNGFYRASSCALSPIIYSQTYLTHLWMHIYMYTRSAKNQIVLHAMWVEKEL